jgi:hypothetical protein
LEIQVGGMIIMAVEGEERRDESVEATISRSEYISDFQHR